MERRKKYKKQNYIEISKLISGVKFKYRNNYNKHRYVNFLVKR